MIHDFRLTPPAKKPVTIDDQAVGKVQTYNYLGCIIQEDLKWDSHITSQIKKCNKRLFLLRQLNKMKVDSKILCLYYNTLISNGTTYVISSWYYNTLISNGTSSAPGTTTPWYPMAQLTLSAPGTTIPWYPMARHQLLVLQHPDIQWHVISSWYNSCSTTLLHQLARIEKQKLPNSYESRTIKHCSRLPVSTKAPPLP